MAGDFIVTGHPPDVAVVIRAATSADAAGVTAMVLHESADSAYHGGTEYFVRRSVAADATDTRCLVAERQGVVIGVLVYGNVAGAVGTGRLNHVTVAPEARRRGVGSSLCDAAIASLASTGTRRVVVEMPDDVELRAAHRLLEARGFATAARVPDYYRDGIDLLIMERDVTAA